MSRTIVMICFGLALTRSSGTTIHWSGVQMRCRAWEGIVEQVAVLLPPTPEGADRASLPVRMMAVLLYLKYPYDLSDDQVLERWLESPTMQYFTGEVYFQHELPCDPSSLTRWRNRLDEAGAEELLAQTIEAASTLRAIRPGELRVVSIDTTVQDKNIAHPTDSRLPEVARAKLAERAAGAGIKLRQSYAHARPPTVILVSRRLGVAFLESALGG